MQVHQQFDVDIEHQACKSVKNETQVDRCSLVNFANSLILQLYWKQDSSTIVFYWIVRKFSPCNFLKSDTQAKVFPCELSKVFKNTYFVEHLQRTSSNDMITARSSVRFIVH